MIKMSKANPENIDDDKNFYVRIENPADTSRITLTGEEIAEWHERGVEFKSPLESAS